MSAESDTCCEMRWTYPLSSVQVTASEKQEESDRQARIVQEQEQARRAETEQIQHARQAKELFEPLQQQKCYVCTPAFVSLVCTTNRWSHPVLYTCKYYITGDSNRECDAQLSFALPFEALGGESTASIVSRNLPSVLTPPPNASSSILDRRRSCCCIAKL